jgi:hypothetical protein
VQRDEALRGVVYLGRHAELRGAGFDGEVPGVRAADPLRDLEVLGRPALRAQAAGGVERQAGVVAVEAAAVLVAGERPPQAGQVDLSEGRRRGGGEPQEERQRSHATHGCVRDGRTTRASSIAAVTSLSTLNSFIDTPSTPLLQCPAEV